MVIYLIILNINFTFRCWCTDVFRFSQREVAAELYEREPAGTVVKHLEARSTSSLLFELIRGNSEDMFSVNPSTGVVTTKRPLDYEATKVYNLSITATNMVSILLTVCVCCLLYTSRCV